MQAAAAEGLLGMTVPTQWGGRGLDYVSYALAIEAVAHASATVAVSLVVHLLARGRSGGPCRAYRTASNGCGRWRVATARGAFALSEAEAGTDAANQQTTRRASGDGYRVTGRKVWVANAEAA